MDDPDHLMARRRSDPRRVVWNVAALERSGVGFYVHGVDGVRIAHIIEGIVQHLIVVVL